VQIRSAHTDPPFKQEFTHTLSFIQEVSHTLSFIQEVTTPSPVIQEVTFSLSFIVEGRD
jgi:hypothetical protein